MNIRIIKIDVKVLELFVRIFGQSSIGNCIPDIEDGKLLFEITILGHCTLYTNDSTVTIFKEDKRVTIDQRDFFKIILL